MDNEQLLNKKLSKVKIAMLSKGAIFYSTILFQLKTVWKSDIPTIRVGVRTIEINPNYFFAQQPEEQIGLLVHECSHIALDHLTRAEDKIPKLWNIACDYVINLLITKAGYKIPSGGLLDARFEDMSAEQVYYLLLEKSFEILQDYEPDCIFSNSEEDKQIIQQILNKASIQSKMCSEPRDIIMQTSIGTFEATINPLLNWETILQNYVDSYINDDYSKNKVNKRYIDTDIIMPTLYSQELEHLVIVIDISGSITDDEFNRGFTEFEKIMEKTRAKKITFIFFDDEIRYETSFTQDHPYKRPEFIRGFYTDITPVFDRLNKDRDVPSLVLIFTDGCFKPLETKPKYPVIWLHSSNYTAGITFGKIINFTHKE